jgi:flagellar hook-length control protein FliK
MATLNGQEASSAPAPSVRSQAIRTLDTSTSGEAFVRDSGPDPRPVRAIGHVTLAPHAVTSSAGAAAHLTSGREPSSPAQSTVDRELPMQIIQSIRMQWAAGGGEARVRLQPDYMGELTVSIKVQQGVVTASLATEVPAVRQWIETNEGALRQALADHGLQLDRLVVTRDTAAAERDEHRRHDHTNRQQQPPRQRPRRRREDEATFDVIA